MIECNCADGDIFHLIFSRAECWRLEMLTFTFVFQRSKLCRGSLPLDLAMEFHYQRGVGSKHVLSIARPGVRSRSIFIVRCNSPKTQRTSAT